MCGIAGFSLTQNSSINARSLSHHLLTQIESRGQMAAGFAFGHEGKVGYFKDKVAGSNLRLKGLPRNAKAVILHTRYATHGSVDDNRNNHPVLSPNNRLALVHNGVIWNHDEVRRYELKEFDTLPDVDTSVIPAVLQKFGTAGVEHLSGDAAVAWLDASNPEVVNLARLESSPVSFTQTDDGSLVFASMPIFLSNALATMNIKHGAILTMGEREYFQMKHGAIIKVDQTPEMQSFSTARWWEDATRGVKNTKSTFQSLGSEEKYDWDNDESFNGYDYDAGGNQSSIPMAFQDDPDYGAAATEPGVTEDLYYTIDQGGNFKSYRTLDSLEIDLKWHANVAEDDKTATQFGDGLSRWMEYFLDVGSFDFDGENLISWVSEPGEIAYHENHSSATGGLGYIRDGVSILTSLSGR